MRLLEVIPVLLPRLAPHRLVLGQIRPQRLRVAAVRRHTHPVPRAIGTEAAHSATRLATPKGREGGRGDLLIADGGAQRTAARRAAPSRRG